jgi:ferritin
MLSKNMEKALNEQVNWELYSSYFYLSMSSYFASISLAGCANWMRVQAQEELFHAMKIYDYINERGGRAILEAIAKPPFEWKSPLHVFEEVMSHEQKVTGLINGLVNLALDERDHATNNFLQWFVAEQVEEESSAASVMEKFKLIGKDKSGLFAIDLELAKRVFTPPAK